MLSRRDIAIVSDVPGTTRDVISTNLSIKGVNVLISDTAGLRDNSLDPIENQGMNLARKAAKNSDGVIFVLDASDLNYDHLNLQDYPRKLILLNKNDLAGIKDSSILLKNIGQAHVVSLKTKENY
jgi:tRNA modification GTPase